MPLVIFKLVCNISPQDGECHQLGTLGPCPPLHILSLSPDSLEPECVLNTSKVRFEVFGRHDDDPCAGEEGVRHHPQEQGACAGWPTCKKHEGMLYYSIHIVY